MGDGISFQTKRALAELDSDGQVPPAPEVNNKTSGTSAAESQARALGLTLEQLRQRQMHQFKELMQKRKGYADGGLIDSIKNGALDAFRMQAEASQGQPKQVGETIKDYLLPQDTVDVGLMMMGPGAKAARRLGGLGLATTSYSPDAGAAVMQKLLQLMYRGRSSLMPIEDNRAIFMSPQKGYASEYAARRARQQGGKGFVDSYLVDPFNVERRGHNILPERGGNKQSLIAYPKEGEYQYMGTEAANKKRGGLVQYSKGCKCHG